MVSVILPNYNHATYLVQRIDSILAQTHQDFELIILDDCSTDHSRNIIEQYRNHNKVAIILYNEQNSGSPFTQWKKGLEHCRGEWVWIAESDDYADPYFLETLINKAQKYPSVGICYSDSNIVDAEGRISSGRFSAMRKQIFGTDHWDQDYFNFGKNEIRDYLIRTCTINNTSAAILNRKVLLSVNAFDKPFRYIGEWYVFLKMLAVSDIFYCNSPLNFVRGALTIHNKQFEYAKENIIVYQLLKNQMRWLDPKLLNKHIYHNTRHSLVRGFNFSRMGYYLEMLSIAPLLTSKILIYNVFSPITERLGGKIKH